MTAADFVPLADVIRLRAVPAGGTTEPQRPREAASEEPLHVVPPQQSVSPNHDVSAHGIADDDAREAGRDAVRDARLFRARLADAFDDAVSRLLRELAAGVLARELRLAPSDLVAIVRRIAERAPVVRLRLAPADASSGAVRDYGVPVVEDSALDAGDAMLELAGGILDVRLGVRVAAVLESMS